MIVPGESRGNAMLGRFIPPYKNREMDFFFVIFRFPAIIVAGNCV